ncbi:MAG: ATP-binding protein [Pseudomonadota bacterium]
MKKLRSIRAKLLLLVWVATFSALTIAGGVFMLYDVSSFRTLRLRDMTTQMELMSYSAVPAMQFVDKEVAAETLDLLRFRPSVKAAAIYDVRGRLFVSYVRPDEVGHAFPELPGDAGITTGAFGMTMFNRIVDNNEILGTAYMNADFQLGPRILQYLGVLLVVMIGAMGAAGIISLWLQRSITRPMRSIADIALGVINNRDYTKRAEKISDDEVGILVDAFNNMLTQIESRTRELQSTNHELNLAVAEHSQARATIQQLNAELEEKVLERTAQLRATNKELESFCYSVSHDLRGPLRAISGFSQALVEELPQELPGDSKRYLDKVLAATSRMGQLIEDLLNLSRVSRGELVRHPVDLSEMTHEVVRELQAADEKHQVDLSVWKGMTVDADPKLLRIVLENLLSNAWKFSSKKENPRIVVGQMKDGEHEVYFVRDNGAGFDMKYADKLFGAFQRLHGINEFPGTGIGLATVQRIVNRHGGRIWCDSAPGNGAVFYFTLKHDRSTQTTAAATAAASAMQSPNETALPTTRAQPTSGAMPS